MVIGCNKKAEYMVSYRDHLDTKIPTHYFCLEHTQTEGQKIKDKNFLFVIEFTNLRDIELGIAEGW